MACKLVGDSVVKSKCPGIDFMKVGNYEYIPTLQQRFDYLLLLRLQCRKTELFEASEIIIFSSDQSELALDHLSSDLVGSAHISAEVHENLSTVSRRIFPGLAFPRSLPKN